MVRLHPLSHCMSEHGMCVPPAAPLNPLHGLMSQWFIKYCDYVFHCVELPLYWIWTVFCSHCWWKVWLFLHTLCILFIYCVLTCLVQPQLCICTFYVSLRPAVNFKCVSLPAQAWTPHITFFMRPIPMFLPIFLLQKNWLYASQDGSLLPPTVLAELTMGDHNTSDGIKNSILYIQLLSLFSSAASVFLSVTFLHCSSN